MIKKIITILFTILILTLVFFAVVKVVANISAKKEIKTDQMLPLQPAKTQKTAKIYWRNNQLHIPYEFWQASPNEIELNTEQKYVLLESVTQTDFCQLGTFSLASKNRNLLIFDFDVNQPVKHSKLEQYAKIMQEKVMLSALTEENFKAQMQNHNMNNMRNCNEWIKFNDTLVGLQADAREDIAVNKDLSFKVGTQKCFSTKKILSFSSLDSSYFKAQEDKKSKKFCFNFQQAGSFSLRILRTDGAEILKLHIIKNNSVSKIKTGILPEKNPSFEAELNIPRRISGWKN